MKLGKCSEAQAIKLRDTHLRALLKAGVTVKLGKQQKKLMIRPSDEKAGHSRHDPTQAVVSHDFR